MGSRVFLSTARTSWVSCQQGAYSSGRMLVKHTSFGDLGKRQTGAAL